MDPALPKPDYSYDLEWYWPFAKFPLDPNDLFTTLHDRFNTRPFPLQDPTAFHKDVYECAYNSDTIDEFYSQLEQRKAQRIEEMSEGWDDVSTLLVSSPTLLSCQMCYDPETRDVKMKPGTKNDSMAQRQFAFLQYARCMSFDKLVTFFDGYVRDKREEQERFRRRADEAIERGAAARRAAAASEAVEETSSDSPRRTSSRTTRSKRKPSRNARFATSESPAASAVAAGKPEPTSSSRRIGPRQADRLSPGQTAESSRAAKRRLDEDAPRSAGKRRRMDSEDVGAEDVDTERPAAAGVPEAAPSPARRRKRKLRDGSLEEARKKKARMVDSPSKRSRQSPRRSANPDRPGRAPSSTESAVDTVDRSPSILSEIPDTTQIPGQYDIGDFFHTQADHTIHIHGAFYMEDLGQPPSGRNSEIINTNQEITPADEDQITHRFTTENSTTAEAATKSPKRTLQKKPGASNRQRVDKRRSTKEQNPSSPKKQSRRKNPPERNPPPSPTQRLLRSTRSSRRDTGQELWFLGDDSVARAVGNTKQT
ncbi:hypothetical protein MKX08_003020 [Trichoderma sp. CBMAI-0020]|nr:hypothetical protein MKX08_003020 [Trichoderma sp. CBMAI-0020]